MGGAKGSELRCRNHAHTHTRAQTWDGSPSRIPILSTIPPLTRFHFLMLLSLFQRCLVAVYVSAARRGDQRRDLSTYVNADTDGDWDGDEDGGAVTQLLRRRIRDLDCQNTLWAGLGRVGLGGVDANLSYMGRLLSDFDI